MSDNHGVSGRWWVQHAVFRYCAMRGGGVAGKLHVTFLRPPERSPSRPALLLNQLRIFRAIQWCAPACVLVDESFGLARALREVWTAGG